MEFLRQFSDTKLITHLPWDNLSQYFQLRFLRLSSRSPCKLKFLTEWVTNITWTHSEFPACCFLTLPTPCYPCFLNWFSKTISLQMLPDDTSFIFFLSMDFVAFQWFVKLCLPRQTISLPSPSFSTAYTCHSLQHRTQNSVDLPAPWNGTQHLWLSTRKTSNYWVISLSSVEK